MPCSATRPHGGDVTSESPGHGARPPHRTAGAVTSAVTLPGDVTAETPAAGSAPGRCSHLRVRLTRCFRPHVHSKMSQGQRPRCRAVVAPPLAAPGSCPGGSQAKWLINYLLPPPSASASDRLNASAVAPRAKVRAQVGLTREDSDGEVEGSRPGRARPRDVTGSHLGRLRAGNASLRVAATMMVDSPAVG